MTTLLRRFLLAAVTLVSALPLSTVASAQSRGSLGVGFNTLLSTEQGLGLGFRVRGAWPMNEDLSLAAGMAVTGFVLGGLDDADYLLDPQISLIVTIGSPQPDRATYVLGGFGAYLPFGDGHHKPGEGHQDARGPTIHAGMGWVRGLYSTRLFYEIDPALVIGEAGIDLVFPFRLGVIF